MKLNAKHLLAIASSIAVLAFAPMSSASAGDSIHIDLPGISIGFHGDHRYNKRYRNKYYRHYNNDYYRDRRYDRRKYRQSRRYYNNRYNDNYYYYDRRSNRRYNNGYRYDDYRSNVCPIDGYSSRYDRNRNCYEHKGHYHCS